MFFEDDCSEYVWTTSPGRGPFLHFHGLPQQPCERRAQICKEIRHLERKDGLSRNYTAILSTPPTGLRRIFSTTHRGTVLVLACPDGSCRPNDSVLQVKRPERLHGLD